MDIEFESADLRKLCSQEQLSIRRLGAPCARKLRARLADLQAVNNVSELIAGRPHPLRRDRAGQFALDLHGGKRLVFKPALDPIPKSSDGGIIWSKVTKVRIVFIGDYHD